ncbi:response regulator [Pedobacter sp. MC2016-14]|uniref:hybrid sensor histidine kinase/response regulator transcription factor n=1 Tax=Pedobacter sp. MC2016-14 TaxID=2897327 RepID=UPI001E5A7C67|nr:hybrid sensor histidine kinase/response regulator transcription factor [Pedobacter sp. MC2016-14]MCD0490545.1 response regulator [Pedobacter sp. MC2016-14]
MFKKLYYIFFFLYFAYNPDLFAQVSNLRFESIGTKDGLSQSNVHHILQDNTGFLWFGTKDGLNKYDGYNFTVYKKSFQDKSSIGSNDIQTITEDKKGFLWIGTGEETLIRFNLNKEKFVNNVLHTIKGIQCIFHDKTGLVWIGTRDEGLFSYREDTGKLTCYKHNPKNPETLSSNNVTCITQDTEGNIWIGTNGKGVNVWYAATKRFKRYYNNNNQVVLTDNHIKFIFEDKKRNIWIGTYGGGLNLFKKENQKFIGISALHKNQTAISVNQNYLLCIAEDNTGNLWVGTENGGLFILNPPTYQVVTYLHSENDRKSISSNTINCIKKDASGNMWMGTSNAGICMTNPNAVMFEHYRHKDGANSLSNNIVNSFFEDSKNNIWIGTDGGGLNKFNEKSGRFEVYKHQASNTGSICGNYVLSVAEDDNHNIWVGTWANGISVISPNQQYRHFKHSANEPGSLSSDYAFYILKDSKGRIWVGTYGGGLDLYLEKEHVFKHFVHDEKNPSSISSNYILTLKEDRKGNLWIGTDGGGLNLFDEKQQRFISKPYQNAGISNDRIGSIYEDAKGFLWLATNFGLNKFNPVTYKNTVFFTENGLANDVITSVLGDKKGHIWISTNKGLSRIGPGNAIKNFTVEDGLQDNEFKYGNLMSSAGRLYFGGKNGFNSFLPESMDRKPAPSSIVFTNFQIFNKNVPVAENEDADSPLKATISETKKIVIPYYLSVFSFEFASLNFASKEKKKYQYQLKGFDDKWHDLGSKNNVTFTNLDAGKYILQVKGTDSEGQWSDAVSEIVLVITPPFWKTWWFILLELLLVIGAVVLFFYYRLAAIRSRNLQLEKEVASRTHELSETNSILLESNEKIQVQNFYLEESNKEIQRKTDKILDQQQHIVVQKQDLERTVNELEGSNKTKDKLFSMIAHDLKNPVTALHGISEQLHRKLSQMNQEEIQAQTKDISNASNSINELVVNLLDWARTQSQNLSYEPLQINVHELVMKNIFLAETQLTNKSISAHLDINIGHVVTADKHMLDAIVRNLINNSIKFTNRNGRITITSRQTDTEVILKFEDTGIGMSEKQVRDIHQDQDKSISYGTSGETGTRLGLQLVKEFIQINKGSLDISSVKDVGSIFTITLPKSVGSTNSNVDLPEPGLAFMPEKVNFAQEDAALLKGKRILIVDDNEEIRNFVKLLLSGTFEIFEAGNGEEGLKIATDAQPDMIITDMMMPVMNGLEFCNRMKGQYSTSHIPIILITSNTGERGQLASYEAGSDAFLTKPINQKILFRVILNLIRNQENVKKRFSGSEDLLPEGISYNKLDEEFIEKMNAYVEEHLNDTDLDYKKICELAGMSRTVLYAKFKALTGTGVHDFIKNIRLKKSIRLLQEGKLNISQIAYEVGFATPSYFTKSFVKKYDIGPKDYVQKLKAKLPKDKPFLEDDKLSD